MTELIGEFENKTVKKGTSKYGNFIVHSGIFYDVESCPELTLSQAVQIIQSKRKEIVLRQIGNYTIFKTAAGYSVTNGKWTAPISTIEQLIMHALDEGDCGRIIQKYKIFKNNQVTNG